MKKRITHYERMYYQTEHMAVTEGFEPSGKFPHLCLSRTVYLAELYHVT